MNPVILYRNCQNGFDNSKNEQRLINGYKRLCSKIILVFPFNNGQLVLFYMLVLKSK